MQGETDRSCAITIFALIDELICDLFLEFIPLTQVRLSGPRHGWEA
jgi:hypothetical protein